MVTEEQIQSAREIILCLWDNMRKGGESNRVQVVGDRGIS